MEDYTKDEFVTYCIYLLLPFFEDKKIAEKWLYVKNPEFGYISPIEMYNRGKGNKIIAFILNAKNTWDL